MEYKSSLRYLYGLQSRGVKFGLKNIRLLLDSLGHPEEAYPTIHIAGTNGKGSTAAFLASAFTEAGYRTGLYSSPHLVRFTERIRVNGREMDEERLARAVENLKPVIEKTRATFFEATTAIAFEEFARQEVDIAIVEVGLGGRLDATNVIRPLSSVVTNVGFDHMEYLGPGIRQIAAEKGGIIKRRIPAILGAMRPAAEHTLLQIARRRGAPVVLAKDRISLDCSSGGKVSFTGKRIRTGFLRVGLEGAHQTFNAALAVSVLDALQDRKSFRARFPKLSSRAVSRGLVSVRKNTNLTGRMTSVGKDRRILLDVAHNQDGMHTAVSSLMSAGKGNFTAVFGAMRDKAYLSMLKQLAWVAETVVTVQPRTKRAASALVLLKAAKKMGIRAILGGSVKKGVVQALRRKGPVLIIGSHYVVGEALEHLAKKKA